MHFQRLDNVFEKMHREFETRLSTDTLQTTKLVVLLPNGKERLLPMPYRVRLLLLYMILLEMAMPMPPKHLVVRDKISPGCTVSTLLQCHFMVTNRTPFPGSNNSITVPTLPRTTCQQHSTTESDQREISLRKCHTWLRRQCVMLLPRVCRVIKLPLDESLLQLSGRLALQCRAFRD